MVGLNLDAILGVPHVEQQHIKVEDGIGGDKVTWTGEITQVMYHRLCAVLWVGGIVQLCALNSNLAATVTAPNLVFTHSLIYSLLTG